MQVPEVCLLLIIKWQYILMDKGAKALKGMRMRRDVEFWRIAFNNIMSFLRNFLLLSSREVIEERDGRSVVV